LGASPGDDKPLMFGNEHNEGKNNMPKEYLKNIHLVDLHQLAAGEWKRIQLKLHRTISKCARSNEHLRVALEIERRRNRLILEELERTREEAKKSGHPRAHFFASLALHRASKVDPSKE